MKSQILTKAQNMCKANGVEFDNSVFETMFNNAKNKAVSAAVTGQGKHGVRSEAGTLAGDVSGTFGLLGSAGATWAILMGGLSAIGPVGWIGIACLAVGAACLAIFGRKNPSSSTLNTKTLIDTFTQSFVDDFSQWVREGGKSTPKVETEVQTGTSDTENGETNKTEDEKKETEEA